MLHVSRTVVAIVIAPFGAMAATLATNAARGDLATIRSSPIAILLVGAAAGVVGLVLVLPVLLWAPRLRLLSHWVAAMWGAGVALAVSFVLLGSPSQLSSASATTMAILGAASGLTYSIAARVLLRTQNR